MALTWEEVVEGVSALPHVSIEERDGARVLCVARQMFARDEGDSMLILCSWFERDALLESGDPSVSRGPTIDGNEFIRVTYAHAEFDAEILEIVGEGWRIAEHLVGLDPNWRSG